MSINIRFIIALFIITALLTVKEIPYANIIIRERLWFLAVVSYIIFAILFIPSDFWVKIRKVNYLIIIFVFTGFLLFIFTLIKISILSELLGALFYGLFWVLVIYKIRILLKSSSEND